ncbi:hypothetical protein L2E82_16761 [Cichorium intybus]|uniref:Uncharacterized protein n=1 Tax=Cichorium intybus TaxID=13427 RepID=A0ACB9F7R7_CICIN|nr:hypothetical protein L2E82_16761 [Cichorium intybus]
MHIGTHCSCEASSFSLAALFQDIMAIPTPTAGERVVSEGKKDDGATVFTEHWCGGHRLMSVEPTRVDLNKDTYIDVHHQSRNDLKKILHLTEVKQERDLGAFSTNMWLERGKQAFYCSDESELKTLQRLGEMMPLQLWETTMDPKTRLLRKMLVDDVVEANVTFSSLMGARVDVRKDMIQNKAKKIDLKNLDK